MAYGEARSGGTYGTRRRRRGRGLLVVLLILLLVLTALLVVADRVSASIAEQRIIDEVSQQLVSRGVRASPPDVSIGGYPFLTQVFAEKYKSISILLRDVSAETGTDSIELLRLDVVANDVRAPIETLRSGQGDIVAQSIQGTATVEYGSVAKLMNQPNLKLAERDGQLLATLPVRLLGQEFTLTGEADVSPVKDAIRVRFRKLTADGLPDDSAVRSAVDGYARGLSIDVPLPPLLFGIQVSDVKPLPEGLAVTASARNVPLNQALG